MTHAWSVMGISMAALKYGTDLSCTSECSLVCVPNGAEADAGTSSVYEPENWGIQGIRSVDEGSCVVLKLDCATGCEAESTG